MCPKLKVLWIVHSWLLLQSRVPNVESALDCTFLIVPSVFSNVYFSVPLDCPFLIAPSISCAQGWQCSGLSILDCSFNLVWPKLTVLWIVHSWLLLQTRVSKVDSVSGLSILDCSFNLVCPKLTVLWIVHSWLSSLRFSLTFTCQCFWIVHSWLLLQTLVPKVDSALDCPFLIVVPSIFSNVYLSVSLDCPFLIVVPSVFSNVYLSVSLDCPFLIAPSISCVQSWQCSGLSILDCSYNLVCLKLRVLWIVHSWLSSLRFSLTFICQCLWIFHSWLLLQSRVPKVDSALDCPFLIAPSISCVQS